MARLRASWRTSLPVVQQPRNPQSESIARTPYDRLRDALAQPDLAQDFNEVPLILSVDELKRDRGDRNVLQGMSTEGIRGVVAQPMEEGAVVALNHWRKLEEVAHHDDLDAPEGAVISPDRPQPCIDGVDEIDADHRNLINDEALHAPVENAKPLPIRQSLRVKKKRRELEKRVDGLRLCIQCSDGRRCDNCLPFTTRTLPKVVDEPCFPCSCSANDEHDWRTSVYRSEGLAHPWRPLIGFVSLKLGPPTCGLPLRWQAAIELAELPRVGHGRSVPRLPGCFRLRSGADNIRLNRSRSPCGWSTFARLGRLSL